MRLPRIFVRDARHAHDSPHAPIPEEIPRQQIQEPGEIQPIRLRAARAAIHVDARGIDHVIRDGVRDQIPVQPKPVAARFVTTDDRCVRQQLQPHLRARNFFQDLIDRAGRNLSDPRARSQAGGDPQLPAPFTQLERDQQRDGNRPRQRGRLGHAGHGRHRYALLVDWNLREA